MSSMYKPKIYVAIATLFVCISCQEKGNASGQTNTGSNLVQEETGNTTNPQPGDWVSLFDGKSVKQWREVYDKNFPSEGWKVHDGMLTVLASNGRQGGGGGSIVTKKEYANFELQLDFKVTKSANSGIKYFVVENPAFFKNDPSGRGIGLEYQVLDDLNHPDAKEGVNGNRTVGSLYDLIPAVKNKKVKPVGQWNHVRLISDDYHIEHWLNGQKVLEYERGSDAFKALVDKSKYSKYPKFGLASKGHILLQDHGTEVSYRNIKIRTL